MVEKYYYREREENSTRFSQIKLKVEGLVEGYNFNAAPEFYRV